MSAIVASFRDFYKHCCLMVSTSQRRVQTGHHSRSSGETVYSRLFAGSLNELRTPASTQIAFLDGLRTIAVLLVIQGHLTADFVKLYGPNVYSRLPFVANGWIGVDLFFVLSGFFIGGQLWKELQREGSVSVGRFMLRRGFRIWPLYFFTFFCVLAYCGHSAAAKDYGWTDLVFLTNYVNHGIVMGSWSLCTEEQFYIIAPLTLAFLAPFIKPLSKARLWLWGLLLGVALLRTFLWLRHTGHFFHHDAQLFAPLYYNFHTHCDGLIMGLIISNYAMTGDKPFRKLVTPQIFVAIGALLLIGLRQMQHEIFAFTGLALFFGSLVWLGIEKPTSIFNSRVFYWISRLSFGMYLNHEYMAPWVVHSVLPRLPLFARFPLAGNLAGIIILSAISAAVALVTFCVVEHPFLKLRAIVLEPRARRVAGTGRTLPLSAQER